MNRLITVAACLCLAGTAAPAVAADPKIAKAHECLQTFKAGNMSGARAAAAEVMRWSGVTDPDAWRRGALCVQMATRTTVRWNVSDDGFETIGYPVDGSIENASRRTYDACVTLLSRDDLAALTNPICSPIFLANGLPE